MGKEFWVGTGLLLLLLVLTLAVTLGMDAIHETTELDQAAQAALDGDMEQAKVLAAQAKVRWDRFWQASAAVADHSPMDEIDRLFAEMEVYAQAQEESQFAAACAQLSELVRSMADAHRLAWWNLL